MTEPWIERVIREAQEAGEFDGLAGTGKPIADLDQPYDPAWWARRWIAREHQREAAAELARSIQRDLPRVLAGTVADDVRIGLESLNSQIEVHNKSAAAGNDVPLLDVDALMSEWAARRRR
jgi:hypothetical protein